MNVRFVHSVFFLTAGLLLVEPCAFAETTSSVFEQLKASFRQAHQKAMSISYTSTNFTFYPYAQNVKKIGSGSGVQFNSPGMVLQEGKTTKPIKLRANMLAGKSIPGRMSRVSVNEYRHGNDFYVHSVSDSKKELTHLSVHGKLQSIFKILDQTGKPKYYGSKDNRNGVLLHFKPWMVYDIFIASDEYLAEYGKWEPTPSGYRFTFTDGPLVEVYEIALDGGAHVISCTSEQSRRKLIYNYGYEEGNGDPLFRLKSFKFSEYEGDGQLHRSQEYSDLKVRVITMSELNSHMKIDVPPGTQLYNSPNLIAFPVKEED